MEFDLREAINAVSDVVANRPPPIREFDQIYMKVADMVIQAHYIADKFDKKDVVFIGDGDAIGLSIMHLKTQRVFEKAPNRIHLLDFDERIVNAVMRFAEKYRFKNHMSASLYNVVEPLPENHIAKYDAFYTNPPWGASNEGESVKVFMERGIEAIKSQGLGAIVIADDHNLKWTQDVLRAAQNTAINFGFLVAEMIPKLHKYHLDDNPNLQSCTCLFRCVEPEFKPHQSLPLEKERWHNFYGKDTPLLYRYVKEKKTLNYGKAPEETYQLEPLE